MFSFIQALNVGVSVVIDFCPLR